jgi:hypothetical protein
MLIPWCEGGLFFNPVASGVRVLVKIGHCEGFVLKAFINEIIALS